MKWFFWEFNICKINIRLKYIDGIFEKVFGNILNKLVMNIFVVSLFGCFFCFCNFLINWIVDGFFLRIDSYLIVVCNIVWY